MDWARMLAYNSGAVDQELLLRNEYLVTLERMDSGLGPILATEPYRRGGPK
jgi:hypothetical protein